MNTLIREHETLYTSYSAAGQLDNHPAQVYASTTSECVAISTGLATLYVSPDAARELAAHLNAAADQLDQAVERNGQGGEA